MEEEVVAVVVVVIDLEVVAVVVVVVGSVHWTICSSPMTARQGEIMHMRKKKCRKFAILFV